MKGRRNLGALLFCHEIFLDHRKTGLDSYSKIDYVYYYFRDSNIRIELSGSSSIFLFCLCLNYSYPAGNFYITKMDEGGTAYPVFSGTTNAVRNNSCQ